VAKGCIETECRSSCPALEAQAETYIAFEIVEIPLLPILEDLSRIGKYGDIQSRRTKPTVFAVDHDRVVAVKTVEAIAAQRIRAA
jgi:hypothetical protein